MAKNTLPVNYKDDILNSTMDGKRRYRMITNSDGTVSFEDVTTYDQVGSNFGAAQLNAANTAVNASADSNKIIDDLSTIAANTQEGYMAGALAVKELNQSLTGYSKILSKEFNGKPDANGFVDLNMKTTNYIVLKAEVLNVDAYFAPIYNTGSNYTTRILNWDLTTKANLPDNVSGYIFYVEKP